MNRPIGTLYIAKMHQVFKMDPLSLLCFLPLAARPHKKMAVDHDFDVWWAPCTFLNSRGPFEAIRWIVLGYIVSVALSVSVDSAVESQMRDNLVFCTVSKNDTMWSTVRVIFHQKKGTNIDELHVDFGSPSQSTNLGEQTLSMPEQGNEGPQVQRPSQSLTVYVG